ncbi:MAG: hypothetical protein IT391_11655 [Nitrospira sp.]|nr:hypothetical protein [Nitrospira sp.]
MPSTLDYALMAGASYVDTRGLTNRFPVPENWVSFKHESGTSGFEAISFVKGTEIVISYAGTNPNDGILPLGPDNQPNIGLATRIGSAQLQQAAEYYLQVKAANPTANITFTGYSLGGGLAALMGVFFGKQAVTFDQAPFDNSAEASVIPPDVAANLKASLLANGHTEAEIAGLTAFLQIRAVLPMGEIPNTSLVTSINVQGEFLSGVPWNSANRIGLPAYIPNSAAGVSGFDLHSQALLTAFLQSIHTAPSQRALNDVTFKLTDLMGIIFAETLYARSTGKVNTTTAEEDYPQCASDPAFPAYEMERSAA